MKRHLIKSVLTLACLALVAVPLPVQAQSSDLSVGIRTNTATISRGGSVGVFAWVQNNSSARMKLSTWFTSIAPCGTETMISGTGRLTLNGGQSIQVTVGYPIPPDACPGMYEVTFHAKAGGKNASENSVTCYVEVK